MLAKLAVSLRVSSQRMRLLDALFSRARSNSFSRVVG